MRLELPASIIPLALALCLHGTATAQSASWVSLNGPAGGSVFFVTQTASGRYLALASNGIYRASGDLHWQRCAGPPPTATFVSFAETPQGVLIASAGMGGVFRSTDDGMSWSGTELGFYCSSIAVNPIAREILVGGSAGVIRSTDDGVGWEATGLTAAVTGLAINRDGVAFAAVGKGVARAEPTDRTAWTTTNDQVAAYAMRALMLASDGSIWAGTSSAQVRRSTDEGISWTDVGSGLFRTWIKTIEEGVAGEIFVGSYDGAFGRTTDDGSTWDTMSVAEQQPTVFSAHRSSDGRLMVGTVKGVQLVGDTAGAPWSLANDGIVNSIPTAIFVSTNGPPASLFVTVSSGITSIGNTDGTEWSTADLGFGGWSGIYSAARDSNGQFVIGVALKGIFESPDGRSWTQLPSWTTSPGIIYSSVAASRDVLYVTSGRTIARTTDRGGEWELAHLEASSWGITSIVVRGDTAWLTNDSGLWRSTDAGATFRRTTSTKTSCVVHTSSGVVYAGSAAGNVLRSTDGGMSWSYSTTAPTAPQITALAINSRGHVYAGASNGQLFFSTDGGLTWTSRSDGLETATITVIAFDAQDVAYVGVSGHGVFKSAGPTTGVSAGGGEARALDLW